MERNVAGKVRAAYDSAKNAATYRTEDRVTVREGDEVYDYYTMEPVIIGKACGDGWFETLRTDGSGVRSQAGMLNGQRICTLGYARQRGFKDA
jgi:hypothetical protein